MKRVIRIFLILSLLILPGCSDNIEFPPSENTSVTTSTTTTRPVESGLESTSPTVETKSMAETLLEGMTIEKKIGQLFILRPEALQAPTFEQNNDLTKNGVTELDEQMQKTLKEYPIGGVILFAQNISTPTQLTTFINALQEHSSIPLFIGIDEEGGSVARIAKSPNFHVTKFESMQKVGETGNPENAKNVGLVIGSYLKQYGINLDFAPVADINTNPENIVIGNRSFGSDPDLVAKMVTAAITGLHQSGVMSCIKHFPGHGDTKGDTHTGYVSIDKTWDELRQCELIPFIHSLNTTDMVMISHITTPNITTDQLPASLSVEMVQGKLRNELGFEGVVISDAMAMGAITQNYSASESAVKAIIAGVDILLMPADFMDAYHGILTAVKDGIISEARIDQSILRILKLKELYHL